MVELILSHFALIGREGEEILSVEEIEAWSPGDVASLKRLKVVKKAHRQKLLPAPAVKKPV